MMAQKQKPAPGKGRPKAPEPREERITIYLTAPEMKSISRLAAEDDRSMSKWVRMQIQRILKRKG